MYRLYHDLFQARTQTFGWGARFWTKILTFPKLWKRKRGENLHKWVLYDEKCTCTSTFFEKKLWFFGPFFANLNQFLASFREKIYKFNAQMSTDSVAGTAWVFMNLFVDLQDDERSVEMFVN